ncbi:hypothetical protein [uncultured Thiothrix sp.]|uniref:hypothetical protein n=1 Tax=uncultured Thiothrix sp. TaxID=223185 RepID=UPI00262E8680|nr:hypothetical protein [uncultured Thiothrix sp.]
MNHYQYYLIILIFLFSFFAYAEDCSKIHYRKDESIKQFNLPTLKALELQEWNNPHVTKVYYPIPMNKTKSQEYLVELLAENPSSAFHPTVFLNAIADCDNITIQRYIQHGLNLHCYNQEGSSNILSWFQHCRPPRMSDSARDQAMEMVLQAGVNPNEGDKNLERDAAGTYPLSIAIDRCDVRMLDTLLKYQANPNLKTKGEEYFPIFNICGASRGYSSLGLPPELKYSPTRTMPLAHILQSLIEHGADPNTIYITDDERNFANQDQDKVLKKACSGQDKNAKSVYDLYAHEFAEAKIEGDPVKIDNFQKLFDVLLKYEAKPLIDLCNSIESSKPAPKNKH